MAEYCCINLTHHCWILSIEILRGGKLMKALLIVIFVEAILILDHAKGEAILVSRLLVLTHLK